MASKNLPTLLRNAKHKGVEDGLITMQNVCLIALDNIAEDYMPEANSSGRPKLKCREFGAKFSNRSGPNLT